MSITLITVQTNKKTPTHRVRASILYIYSNNKLTRQNFDCHHQLLLFVFLIVIVITNMKTIWLTKKLILSILKKLQNADATPVASKQSMPDHYVTNRKLPAELNWRY